MKTAFWLALTSLVVFGCGEEDIGQQTGGAITGMSRRMLNLG